MRETLSPPPRFFSDWQTCNIELSLYKHWVYIKYAIVIKIGKNYKLQTKCVCVYLLVVDSVSLCKMRDKDLLSPSSKETQYLEQVLQQMCPHWILLSLIHISLITENLTQIRRLERGTESLTLVFLLLGHMPCACNLNVFVHMWDKG